MTRATRRPARPVVHSDTRTYAETPLHGRCEAPDCDWRARSTCADCEGEFCRTHAEHGHHGLPATGA